MQPPLESIQSKHLLNGLVVNLTVATDPGTADVAFCSSDSQGDPGPLNQMVFRAAGVDPTELRRQFTPPAAIIHGGRIPVIVIETVGAGSSTAQLLRENLKAGIRLLNDVPRRRMIWIPLLGTGDGGLSYDESAETIFDVLSRWPAPAPTELVELAVPRESVAAQVWSRLGGHVNAETVAAGRQALQVLDDLERHVAIALHVAAIQAGSRQVAPLDVLVAVVSLASGVNSPAFTEMATLVDLKPVRQMEKWFDSEASDKVELSGLAPELARWLVWAREQRISSQAGRIWGRDLVTATLLCRDGEMADALERAGTPLDVVRERWYVFVCSDPSHRTRSEWDAWWAAAGVALPGPHRAGFSPDSDQGDDRLGVEAEAVALARLILDQEVTPPLSIGLLGDWGSGKSFLIQQIKRQVAALRGQAGLLEHVVEIEFNAWHASDANLWANLVTHIFDEIWRSVDIEGEERDPASARRQLMDEMKKAGGALQEADAQVNVARDALRKAEKRLADRRSQLAWTKMVTSITKEHLLDTARRAGWHEPLEIINEVEGAASRLADSRVRLRLMLSSLADQPFRAIVVPALIGVAAVGAIVALAHVREVSSALAGLGLSGGFGIFASKLAAAIAATFAPLRLASVRVRKLVTSLDTVAKVYNERLRAKENEAPEFVEHVLEARREFDSSEAAVAAASAHLADLQNRLAALEPSRRLEAFLQERVQSSPYRPQQGIIALVHRDFQQLSERMRDWRAERAKGTSAEAGHIQPIDRIIIYVDDLDRCRPDHVVNMLEAVNLLLALDLFVVVVAVDSRWLMCSLELHYKDLLEADSAEQDEGSLRASTAQNYLEKIFQITYALGPMNNAKFTEYAAFLTGTANLPARQALPEVIPKALDPSGNQLVPSTGPAAPVQPGPPPETPPDLVPTPAPSPVRIGLAEREFLCTIAPLLPTPRIAKRVVNVYRLIKAGKTADDLGVFERERARPCLLMLAILFGHTAVSLELFRKLHQGDPPFHDADETMVKALDNMVQQGGSGRAWKSLLRDLEQIGVQITVGACAREAQETARYSLATGRDWHTWCPAAPRQGTSEGATAR